MKWLFWLIGNSDENSGPNDDQGKDTVGQTMSRERTISSEQALFEALRAAPDGSEALSICNNADSFKQIRAFHWITLAKQHPVLFTKILERPELAGWVNGFPAQDPQGLMMIATFSREHLLIAQHAMTTTDLFTAAQGKLITDSLSIDAPSTSL